MTFTMMLIGGAVVLAALLALPRVVTNWIVDREAPAPPRGVSLLWPSLLVLLMGLLLDPSGFLLVLFVAFWCLVWAWRLWPRWVAALPSLLLLSAVIAFAQGYKLYGSAELVDNRPLLTQPLVAVRLEAPNVVVAADGSRHAVAGMEFAVAVLELPPERQRLAMGSWGEVLRFAPDSSQPSGYVAERRIDYCCGNTFFPILLPQRLPTHAMTDLAVTLRWLATQDPTGGSR